MQQVTENTGYVSTFLHQLLSDLPKLLGAIVILLIGFIVAKALAAIVRKALESARLNQHLHSGKGGNIIQKAIPDPTKAISLAVYWLIFLFAISIAVSALGIPALVKIVNGIYAYIPNVIAAVIIFLVAGAISAAIAGLVAKTMGDTPTGKLVAGAAPVMVMGLAVFMILNQLKIAPAIVTITYAGIVATATLAFGLGGKDAASKMFMGLYEAGQTKKDDAKSDFKQGVGVAISQAKDLRNKVN